MVRIICDGDNHYPVHDPKVQRAKLKFAADIKPDVWVNVGDHYDFFSVSKYDKEPDRRETLQDEFDSSVSYWEDVCDVTKGDVHYLQGNHEHRLERLIRDMPGLHNLRGLALGKLADLPSRVKWRAYGEDLRLGRLLFMHGDNVGGRFGVASPASWVLSNMPGINVVFGHFHRSEVKLRTARDPDGGARTFVACAQGHGSDVRKAKYDKRCPYQDWQHGFTYIETYRVDGKERFQIHPIVIVDGRFAWNGRVYDGR